MSFHFYITQKLTHLLSHTGNAYKLVIDKYFLKLTKYINMENSQLASWSWWSPKSFLHRAERRSRCSYWIHASDIKVEVLFRAIGKEKDIKDIRIGKRNENYSIFQMTQFCQFLQNTENLLRFIQKKRKE